MTDPRKALVALADQMDYWADRAESLEAGGLHDAALAADDQAFAAEAHARKIARDNGLTETLAVWDEP